jgi:hypothetical protein
LVNLWLRSSRVQTVYRTPVHFRKEKDPAFTEALTHFALD